jgi:hypothetical protein
MLIAAAKALASGEDPTGTRTDLTDVRAFDRTLPARSSWKDLCPGHWTRGNAKHGQKAGEPA